MILETNNGIVEHKKANLNSMQGLYWKIQYVCLENLIKSIYYLRVQKPFTANINPYGGQNVTFPDNHET